MPFHEKTNLEICEWLDEKKILNNNAYSQDQKKEECKVFFGDDLESIDKKIINKRLNMFKMNHKNIKLKIQREILIEMNGKGPKNYDPPDDFSPTAKYWMTYMKLKYPNNDFINIDKNECLHCGKCNENVDDLSEHMKYYHYIEVREVFIRTSRIKIEGNVQYINWQNESSNIFNLTNLKQNKNKLGARTLGARSRGSKNVTYIQQI